MSNLIATLGLTDAQKTERLKSLGGSDANVIMGGDPEKVYRLWEEKTGKRESDDLSGILAVMMGHATEEFNVAWYEKITGDSVTNRNETRKHPKIPYMACNLDGICKGGEAVWEAKHVGGFETIDIVIQRYMPQLHHNAGVCGLNEAVISVLIGNGKYEWFPVDIDPFYLEQVIEAEESFWKCVTSDTPPVNLPEPPKPPPHDKMREVDMSGNNQWASLAVDYFDNHGAAALFEKSKSELKKLVDPDVKKAYGYGLVIQRDKRGALRITEDKSK